MKYYILITLFFCHFLADFTPMSTPWMLNAKRFGKPWLPVFCHALVHACLMSTAIRFFILYHTRNMEHILYLEIELFFFQLISHFCIDMLKGKLNYYYPSIQSPDNAIHWVVFGADQFLHSVVIILMVSRL